MTVGEYKILHKIGKGAFGDVYKVKDSKGLSCAMKVLQKDKLKTVAGRQINEIEVLTKVCHPNIV
jgi:serine/threonine protein kinase